MLARGVHELQTLPSLPPVASQKGARLTHKLCRLSVAPGRAQKPFGWPSGVLPRRSGSRAAALQPALASPALDAAAVAAVPPPIPSALITDSVANLTALASGASLDLLAASSSSTISISSGSSIVAMAGAGGSSSGAGTLWATAAVMFAGALLTGLPAVWWTLPDSEAAAAKEKEKAGGARGGGGGRAMRVVQGLLQGPGARALTAGLMLGSGLGVVLPEGFFAFVEGAPDQGDGGLGEWAAGAALVAGFAGMLVLQLVLDGWVDGGSSSNSGSSSDARKRAVAGADKLRSDGAAAGATAPAAAMELSWRRAAAELAAGADEGVGLAVAGVDSAGGGAAGSSRGRGGANGGAGGGARSPELALAGLLVHSAADGLAVGAASLGGGLALSLTVAAAIMAHKLPVTCGLSAFLRAAGWSRRRAAQGLLAFAASAPLAALLTFYVLGAALGLGGAAEADTAAAAAAAAGSSGEGGSSGGGSTQQQYVALAVLFSGGTFLAAATQHILPAALQQQGHGHDHGHGHGHGNGHGHGHGEYGGGGGGSSSGGATPRGDEAAAVRLLLDAEEAGGGAAAAGSSSMGGGAGGGGSSRGDGAGGAAALLLLALGAVLPLVISALLPEAD